jgi:hypothetical protein
MAPRSLPDGYEYFLSSSPSFFYLESEETCKNLGYASGAPDLPSILQYHAVLIGD